MWQRYWSCEAEKPPVIINGWQKVPLTPISLILKMNLIIEGPETLTNTHFLNILYLIVCVKKRREGTE